MNPEMNEQDEAAWKNFASQPQFLWLMDSVAQMQRAAETRILNADLSTESGRVDALKNQGQRQALEIVSSLFAGPQ